MSKEERPNEKIKITIKTVFGLEEVLKEELAELGYSDVEILNRAVQLEGTWRDVYFFNLHLRCAIAVLVEIDKFRIKNEDDLYKKAAKIDWPSYFDHTKTFAVKGAVFSSLFNHTQYPALLLKDAIVDTFRNQGMERPNVQLKTPQVMFDLYIKDVYCTVSLNTSGAPLFQRGYRDSVGEAPLNEVVAAGLLRLANWTPEQNLYDPFCGSGTILMEAAMRAANIPPAIERQHFAFKNFKNFDREMWEDIQDEASRGRITELPCKIVGSDLSADMMMKAKRNLRGLGLARLVEVKTDAFQEATKPFEEGIVVTNPPYGERIGENVETMYEEMGTWMKHELPGYECWVISSNMEALKCVGLKPSKKFRLFNGDLECSFRRFDMYKGSKKASKQGQDEYDQE